MPRTAVQARPTRRGIALLSATIALLAGLLLTPATKAATGGYPYASVEGPGSDAALGTWVDPLGNRSSPYGYLYRNCTDFVAWKLSTTNGVEDVRGYGDAAFWVPTAIAHGYRVDEEPAPGAVAWWGSGEFGHVAWVAGVAGRSVRLQEYNYAAPGRFNTRTIRPSGAEAYIHFGDLIPMADGKGKSKRHAHRARQARAAPPGS